MFFFVESIVKIELIFLHCVFVQCAEISVESTGVC